MPSKVLYADPILDSSEGTLTMQFEDGTSRIYNWDYVVSYYHMTVEETRDWLQSRDDDDD